MASAWYGLRLLMGTSTTFPITRDLATGADPFRLGVAAGR